MSFYAATRSAAMTATATVDESSATSPRVASWGESERSVRTRALPRARFLATKMAALQMTL